MMLKALFLKRSALIVVVLTMSWYNCNYWWEMVPVEATEIKWTGNSDSEKTEAATAPKSQRYWDEHNIERPDYAKTDAEIAKEQGGSSWYSSWLGIGVFVGIAVGYYVRYHVIPNNKELGHQLGSLGNNQNPLFFLKSDRGVVIDDEKVRKARLARFEVDSSSKQE